MVICKLPLFTFTRAVSFSPRYLVALLRTLYRKAFFITLGLHFVESTLTDICIQIKLLITQTYSKSLKHK